MTSPLPPEAGLLFHLAGIKKPSTPAPSSNIVLGSGTGLTVTSSDVKSQFMRLLFPTHKKKNVVVVVVNYFRTVD